MRDNCHLSGKFRGAAHEVCNLKYKNQKFFQLYFTICLAMIATYLVKHLEIAKEIIFLHTNNNNNNNNNNVGVFISRRLHPDDNERVIAIL